ncbi:hypothetical protein [Caenispirillum salinarum]|uniref:hypothetical protein n=1 Tax=Caenispirillum salinarum TaxID=859058 RepID=UPI00384CD674
MSDTLSSSSSSRSARPGREHPLGVSQEAKLLRDLRSADGKAPGKTVAEVGLSRMDPMNRTEAKAREIADAFAAAVGAGARLYWMRDWTLMVLFDEASAQAVQAALVRLRFVLGGDPLAEDRDLVVYRPFVRDYEALIAETEDRVVSGAAAGAASGPGAEARGGGDGVPRFRTAARQPRGEPLTPGMLGRIESMLVNANLSSHIRRQSVCVMVAEGKPEPMFTEVFVSIADLRETLLPRVDLASNPWLFQRLTQTLDRRVLAMLTHRDDATLVKGFSINLNVASILSDEFLAFDDNMAAGSHGTVVIELRPEDIFADLGAFTFARDFVRQRGYRVCLDGLTWRSLPYVSARRLGAEMVKLNWSADLPSVLDGPEGKPVREAMEALPPGKLVLARCDSEDAVAFGQENDITLYQGRIIDTWMRERAAF